jgi:hypothetical protein
MKLHKYAHHRGKKPDCNLDVLSYRADAVSLLEKVGWTNESNAATYLWLFVSYR